ncbi:hypothetical protein BA768_18820 [Chryseobacterium sp. CBo1]|uniref:Sodium:proton antiporter n=1 Tax=Candidatus Chryseobacterium massiliense TaxID=204089 RepID=A0A3D9B0T2_9FLAO|nr:MULTISPECIES: cation:proton antiporter [Chryseobacterium]OCK50772.1 hypothetical protein BA768_18820 [Chryseobacterium sp. CBo1]REC46917.1 sodium:proton antiporter [Candidatus Chryseobacterium massiliae]
MENYLVILTIIGIAGFTVTWMPQISEKTGISYSIFYLFAGMILYSIFPEKLPDPLPKHHIDLTVHLSELIVIISLMSAGIKLDQPFAFKTWRTPLKLVSITMILLIAFSFLAGYYLLNLTLASAFLLAAALSPTDPVLASDVQVGPPNDSEKSKTKFILTAEAGLNDGMAFPFVWLAIIIAKSGSMTELNIVEWFSYDVIYKIIVAVVISYLLGKAVGYLLFTMSKKFKSLNTNDGLLALTATLSVYGITEFAHGYGFIAVFIFAITLRHYEKDHEYHKKLHAFTDQTERFLLASLLIIFGGMIVRGILNYLSWETILFSFLFIFVARPLFSYIVIFREKYSIREKRAISFFGIKGLGSIFYLAFAIKEFNFPNQNELWSTVSFVILLSILFHGFTAPKAMKKVTETL